MEDETMCRIPIEGHFSFDKHGNMIEKEFVYEDIPADIMARFLIKQFGAKAIFGEGAEG